MVKFSVYLNRHVFVMRMVLCKNDKNIFSVLFFFFQESSIKYDQEFYSIYYMTATGVFLFMLSYV